MTPEQEEQLPKVAAVALLILVAALAVYLDMPELPWPN